MKEKEHIPLINKIQMKSTLKPNNNQKSIEKRLEAIEERNNRVELDKSWETSSARKLLIAGLTYIIIVSFFFVMNLSKPFINAIVPTIGFMLSTLTLSYFKKVWIQNHSKNK